MFEVKADPAKNLLWIRFLERFDPKEAKACVKEVQEILVDFQPGFRLVTDLSGLDSMDLACAPHMKKSMELCNAAGVSKVVRIIPDPRKDIGLNIMSLFHYRRRIPIVTCKNEAEARKAMSE